MVEKLHRKDRNQEIYLGKQASKFHSPSSNNRLAGFMPLYVALVLGSTSSVRLLEDDRGDGIGQYKVLRFQV